MKKCEDCKDKDNFVAFEYNCIHHNKCLYKNYDHLLIKNYFDYFNQKMTEDEMIYFSHEIESSYLEIKKKIESDYYTFPDSPSIFIEMLKTINGEIFKKTGIGFFGKFREKEIYFDVDAHHREGSKPEKIEIELTKFFNDYFLNINNEQWNNEERFLRLSSIFLETFFRIHPFPDGNGRTGRLFLILMGVHSKKFYFERFDIHNSDEKDYLKALRAAHKFYDHESPSKRKMAYNLLIEWLKSKLTHSDEFTGIEEPPIR
ncbi:Fic family protein [Fluviispira sanaruensis]|uniref:Fido domain-containing protein n=1 Tax=Fluviispira sanaruensis TaxID=2493639 RepID=A0A4P2VQN3_FLUSA|nr:Fic family protein [Fluviispira sanaruensis]BBH54740.1 hypothetical protein JCM31447_32140 [Fluviispira sanaruensis]